MARKPNTDRIWDDMNSALHAKRIPQARLAAERLLLDDHKPFLVDYTWTLADMARHWSLDRNEVKAIKSGYSPLSPLHQRLESINREVDRNWNLETKQPGNAAVPGRASANTNSTPTSTRVPTSLGRTRDPAAQPPGRGTSKSDRQGPDNGLSRSSLGRSREQAVQPPGRGTSNSGRQGRDDGLSR